MSTPDECKPRWISARWIAVPAAVVLSLTLISSVHHAAEKATIEPGILETAEVMERSGRKIPVIVQFDEGLLASGSDSEIAKKRSLRIAMHGGEPDWAGAFLPLVSAKVNAQALRNMQGDPGIQRISMDREVKGSLSTTAAAVGASQVWKGMTGVPGFDGTSVGVAVLDSGMNKDPDLDINVIGTFSFTGDGIKTDAYGHGVHVAGIVAGTGNQSKSGTGYPAQYKGIAPDGRVVSLRVLDANGYGLASNVIKALDWCIANKAKYKLRVVNLSLGHPVYQSYKTDPLCQAVERCVKAGLVVVVAAGNFGKSDGNVVYGSITSPANHPAVITVGAADTKGTVMRSDDTVASYSSRGPTAVDGIIKPDIVAPGNALVSVSATAGGLYGRYPDNRRYGVATKPAEYFVMSGTSMAAPVVSGTVALMLEANPTLTPNLVKAILQYTAQRMTLPNMLEQGAGYINVPGAVRLAYAISRTWASTAPGSPIIANPNLILPRDTIAGEAVLWGDGVLWGENLIYGSGILWGEGVLWGDGILWGEGVLWGENTCAWSGSMIGYNQGAFSGGILWGEGVLWGNGILWGQNLIWDTNANAGNFSLLDALYPHWCFAMGDPNSIAAMDESVAINGESGNIPGIVLGPPGAWFYPVR